MEELKQKVLDLEARIETLEYLVDKLQDEL